MRLFIIGKDATLAGVREVQGAVAKLNAEIASGAKASATAAAGYKEQMAGLEELQAKMALYQDQLATVSAETDAVAKVGKVAFFGIAAAAGVIGYESVKWAKSFQTQLTLLRTQAGLTVTAMRAVKQAAMANSANLGIGPTTYVKAAYHPASAGFRTGTAIRITNASAMLAGIGGAPIETTVNAVTGIMRAYNLRGPQAKSTAALVNATIGAGNMRMSTFLGAAASGVYSTGKTFGVSASSVGGALAFLTDRGVPASQAGTHLRMTLGLLGAPSAEATKILTASGLTTAKAKSTSNAMAQLERTAGVTVTQLSRALRTNKGPGGIYHALALLHSHLAGSGMSPEMQAATISRSFGGGRMGTTVESMYNSLPTLGKKGSKIAGKSSSKDLMKDWSAYTKTLTYQMKRFEHTIQTLGTALGEKLIPPLTKIVHVMADVFQWFGKNKNVARDLAVVIGAVLVPAIAVYLRRALLSTNGAIMTVVRGYGDLARGNNTERIALQRLQAQLGETTGATDGLAAADARLGGAASSAAGKVALEDEAMAGGGVGSIGGVGSVAREAAGGAGLKAMLMGAAGKLGMGGMVASITTPLINQYAGKYLKSALGTRGKTDLMDAATGAQMGMFFGPEGALAGGVAGLAYGERGHLKQDLYDIGYWEHDAQHDAARGLDVARHHIANVYDGARHEATHLLDDINPFSSSSSSASPAPRREPFVIHNHVTVEIDGKQMQATVKKHARKEAARTS
ncbi:MAG: phage tail tape measure protein [Acidimicrobiales bacterium]